MSLLPLILLALVQGITEFLPISSSGHLLLLHTFFEEGKDWETRIILDVSMHIGTLFSIMFFFHRDMRRMLGGIVPFLRLDFKHPDAHLNLCVLIGSLPVMAGGVLLYLYKPHWLTLVQVVAWNLIIFGIILWWADRRSSNNRDDAALGIKDAFLIGLAQTLALIPGTSRSGITMTAGRLLGFGRVASARFSMLLSMIAIIAAGALGIKDLIKSGDTKMGLDALIGFGVSFITGLLVLHFMMRWLAQFSFMPFALYRIALGLLLLALIYSGSWATA